MPKKEKNKPKTFYEEFKDSRLGSQRFLTDNFIEELCQKLITFALESDGAESIALFIAKQGIPHRTWHNWLEKYSQIKDANEEAKHIIGQQRLTNALRKQLDSGLVKFTLYNYMPEMKETQEWLAKIKEQAEEVGPTTIVLIDPLREREFYEAQKKDPDIDIVKWKEEHPRTCHKCSCNLEP